jgi:hypothetical protein
MTVPVNVRRLVTIAIPAMVLGLLSAGCGSTLSGSAIAASTIATTGVSPPSSSTDALPPFTGAAESGAWSAAVEAGPGNGIPSPNGDLSVQFARDQVCFVPVAGDPACGPLAAGATPTFAVFSQDRH